VKNRRLTDDTDEADCKDEKTRIERRTEFLRNAQKTFRTNIKSIMNNYTLGIAMSPANPLFSSGDSEGDGMKLKVSHAATFPDVQLLQYEVPGWNNLEANQKELAYYLYEASLSGRDIIYDQRGKYNLTVRKTIEAIWANPETDKSATEWSDFETYSGQVWF